jgi:hypothetical protein
MRHLAHRLVYRAAHNLTRYDELQIYSYGTITRSPHFLTLSQGPEKPMGTRSPLTPAVLVLIVGLKVADSHAGSISIFGHSRNLSIGRGLAPLP